MPRSAARAFLARHGQPESLADAVAGCLKSLDQDEPGGHLAEKLGLFGKSWSDVDWTRSRIDQLICVNLAVIVVSILSMRGGRRRLRQLPHEEMVAHDANLLLAMNEVNVSLHEYLERVGELTADPPALQKAMLEYVYFARKLLIGRRKMLQLTYNIFVYGLAVSVLLFVIAIVRS